MIKAQLLNKQYSSARKGYGPTEQEWGYVEVREGAHIFWWLQQTSADVDDYTEKPLLIWLQGGPGSSSTGYGNFAELGPLDADLNPRNTSWINFANVLFVDNPVGTGFSYADNIQQLATTNRQIADDFLVLLQGFYEAVPALKSTPLYIFCESYGGKMTAEIALVLDQVSKTSYQIFRSFDKQITHKLLYRRLQKCNSCRYMSLQNVFVVIEIILEIVLFVRQSKMELWMWICAESDSETLGSPRLIPS